MPTAALAFALTGAFLHAGWNTLLARSDDTRATTAVALVAAVVVFAPLALLTWQVSLAALPYVGVSALLELCYFGLLATAYRRAEMSLIYPLARGLGPCFVLALSVALLGVRLPTLGILGVLLVALGIVLVRGGGRPSGRLEVGLTVAIAACTAGYTLIDKAGLRYAEPLPYFWLVTALTSGGYVAALLISRGSRALQGSLRPSAVLAGLAMFAAYSFALAALQIAPAAPVAAVRETSVVIATALGALVLHERVDGGRIAGALLVVLGVVALALA